MSWSMKSVSFRMSGSGSWQNLLPDEASGRLYAEMYPMGISLPKGSGPLRKLLSIWKQAAIVRFEKEKVIPLGPIMTDADLLILSPWFQDISEFMGQAVLERLEDYRVLARTLGLGNASSKSAVDNIMTILICALTLDSGVFSGLRREVIGSYPSRDFAGTFFFWGYGFVAGPQRIFGFTTYNGLDERQLHIIRSHGLDRRAIKERLRQQSTWDYLEFFFLNQERVGLSATPQKKQNSSLIRMAHWLQTVGLVTSDNPPSLAVPVFGTGNNETISELCRKTSNIIVNHFMAGMEELKGFIEACSFARCSRPDVLCMLFHLAYSYAADQLVAQGVISDFPDSAGGEWGVWIS